MEHVIDAQLGVDNHDYDDNDYNDGSNDNNENGTADNGDSCEIQVVIIHSMCLHLMCICNIAERIHTQNIVSGQKRNTELELMKTEYKLQKIKTF